MKNLPKVYKNKKLNKIENNSQVFDSLKVPKEIKEVRETKVTKPIKKSISVKKKIKELLEQNNYIFNTKVKITLENKEKIINIAGVVNNHVIKMDNEIIKIEDIINLEILD